MALFFRKDGSISPINWLCYAEIFIELVERRHDETSTVFCTQYKLENWHSRLGGGILADSIMDRIVHKAVNVYAGNLNMRELLSKAE